MKTKNSSTLFLLAALVVMFLFLCASRMDYRDQVRAGELYHFQVCSGELPDWSNRRPDCSRGVVL